MQEFNHNLYLLSNHATICRLKLNVWRKVGFCWAGNEVFYDLDDCSRMASSPDFLTSDLHLFDEHLGHWTPGRLIKTWQSLWWIVASICWKFTKFCVWRALLAHIISRPSIQLVWLVHSQFIFSRVHRGFPALCQPSFFVQTLHPPSLLPLSLF